MTNVSSTVFTKVRENTSIPNLLNLCCVEGFVKYGVWVAAYDWTRAVMMIAYAWARAINMRS